MDEKLRDYAPSEIIDLLGGAALAEFKGTNGLQRDTIKMLAVPNDMLIPRQAELLAQCELAAVRELIRERIV